MDEAWAPCARGSRGKGSGWRARRCARAQGGAPVAAEGRVRHAETKRDAHARCAAEPEAAVSSEHALLEGARTDVAVLLQRAASDTTT